MEFIRGMHNIKPHHRHCVAAIGNFDGVHLGHQRILQQLAEEGLKLQLPVLLIIFEPQPQEYFEKGTPHARLTRLREKLLLFKQYDIDRVLCLRFDQKFSRYSAQEFIQTLLINQLAVHYLVVGDDFCFGYQRAGNFALLKETEKKYDFHVTRMDTVWQNGERVSSTRLRNALAVHNLQLAESLLNRPYSLCGRVAHGDKRGRILGFPTANVYLHRAMSPLKGVYAVKVYGLDRPVVFGVANVGNRPTVGGTRSLLEIHLFDFEQDIYGHYIRVDFIHHLRDEKRFDTFDLLCEQIKVDAKQAASFFSSNEKLS